MNPHVTLCVVKLTKYFLLLLLQPLCSFSVGSETQTWTCGSMTLTALLHHPHLQLFAVPQSSLQHRHLLPVCWPCYLQQWRGTRVQVGARCRGSCWTSVPWWCSCWRTVHWKHNHTLTDMVTKEGQELSTVTQVFHTTTTYVCCTWVISTSKQLLQYKVDTVLLLHYISSIVHVPRCIKLHFLSCFFQWL